MTKESTGETPIENKLIEVLLDEETIIRDVPEIEHFRESAMFDLIEYNHFELPGRAPGPYTLLIVKEPEKLIIHMGDKNKKPIISVILAIRSFRPLMRDYTLLCDSYYEAIKTSTAANIEAIDMGRRGLHNEGAQKLLERLKGKIEIDIETARRLFALICAIYRKG